MSQAKQFYVRGTSGIKDEKEGCQYEWGETEDQKRVRKRTGGMCGLYGVMCALLYIFIAY